MVTPKDAIKAAVAATSSHDAENIRKDRPPNFPGAGGHRSNGSGGLSQQTSFAFIRPGSSHDQGLRSDTPSPIIEEPPSPRASSAMSSALQQRKSRTRKGSLRKSALLGTSKMRIEGREQSHPAQPSEITVIRRYHSEGTGIEYGGHVEPLTPIDSSDVPTPGPLPVPPPVPMVTHPVHGDPSKILEVTDAKEPFPELKRPFKAKYSTMSTTTEEDDSIVSPSDLLPGRLQNLTLTNDSYFPAQPAIATQVGPAPRSPLGALPPSLPTTSPAEWDYSETRWWGWIILCVTWIVFVVGMGSCFGVWSWAWDVGETPYAPPELEDDPTLPIVGYYPALMVLTSVMAWVWVTVAWVGMKYFRHANISGDDD